ncbi:MAG: PT domain-containing protein, partial [Oscillospiraceae bacterium]|nr:PT domain-containing protein [Oscillospiraceae bacterium]
SLAACSREPEPTAEPTVAAAAESPELEPTAVPTAEPTAAPEPELQDPLERALSYLRQRDRDGNYVTAHMGTYQELYKLTHPGADLQILWGGIGAKEITVQVAGVDAQAFGEAGIFSDRITVSVVKSGGPDFSQDLPIPWEPETDHLSERGMRITMERAVWPVGTEYLRFTIGNETNRGLEGNEICLEKYTEGGWKRYVPRMSIGGDGLYLEAHSACERFKDLQFYPRLGEGLYRIIVTPGDDWAEFVVRSDAEPLDMTPVKYRSWPEAALLLAGLPENVESELHETEWPALSWKWRLTEDRRVTDEELAALLLGEEAEYDPETELWRAGNRTLDLKDGAHLTAKDPLVRAVELLVPAWGADTLDSCSIPTTAEAGWVSAGRFVSHTIPFLSLYDGRREEIGITDQAGILRSAELVNGGGYKVYVPDCAILTARLEELLAEKRAELGEAAFLAEYGDLADFSFRTEELARLYLVQVPIRARLMYAIEAFAYEAADFSPWGEPEGAAWFLYDMESREILALSARYLGYRLEPEDAACETISPMEQAEKFLPLMEGEEGLHLTG